METANGQVLSLKEQLANRADLRVKTVNLIGDFSGMSVVIRRATVGERKRVMERHKDDAEGLGEEMVRLLCVPELSQEDFDNLPSIVAEQLADEIVVFNGWTKRGSAELADQFPAKP